MTSVPEPAASCAARAAALELDTEQRIHDADPFGALRVEPDELPLEPSRSGRWS
jgi:hypothetical protein